MKLKTKLFLVVSILIIIVILFINYKANEIKQLSSPELSWIPEKTGKYVAVEGKANPEAKVSVYLNGDFVSDTIPNQDGRFTQLISFKKDGQNTISVKQYYKDIVSPLSLNKNIEVDITPPPKDNFEIITKIPETSKDTNILIEGKTVPGLKVKLAGVDYKVDENGFFDINHRLLEGKNTLEFSLSDEYNNTTDILKEYVIEVDTKVPVIQQASESFCKLLYKPSGPTEEWLCIDTGTWESWENPAPIPIVGRVYGAFKSITINGKTLSPDENNEIYQRVYLPVPKGLNKYKVVAEDYNGNKTSTYIEMTVSRVDNNSYDDINDRLDDIEYKIDDLDY